MNNIHTILIATAFVLAVVSIMKPAWPILAVAVILLCVDLFIK